MKKCDLAIHYLPFLPVESSNLIFKSVIFSMKKKIENVYIKNVYLLHLAPKTVKSDLFIKNQRQSEILTNICSHLEN